MREKPIDLTLPWFIYQFKEGNQIEKGKWIVHSSYAYRDSAETNLRLLNRYTSNIVFKLSANPVHCR